MVFVELHKSRFFRATPSYSFSTTFHSRANVKCEEKFQRKVLFNFSAQNFPCSKTSKNCWKTLQKSSWIASVLFRIGAICLEIQFASSLSHSLSHSLPLIILSFEVLSTFYFLPGRGSNEEDKSCAGEPVNAWHMRMPCLWVQQWRMKRERELSLLCRARPPLPHTLPKPTRTLQMSLKSARESVCGVYFRSEHPAQPERNARH